MDVVTSSAPLNLQYSTHFNVNILAILDLHDVNMSDLDEVDIVDKFVIRLCNLNAQLKEFRELRDCWRCGPK
jgi:hypothetical protein